MISISEFIDKVLNSPDPTMDANKLAQELNALGKLRLHARLAFCQRLAARLYPGRRASTDQGHGRHPEVLRMVREEDPRRKWTVLFPLNPQSLFEGRLRQESGDLPEDDVFDGEQAGGGSTQNGHRDFPVN